MAPEGPAAEEVNQGIDDGLGRLLARRTGFGRRQEVPELVLQGSQCCERMPVPSRARALLAKSTASGVPNFMSAFNLSDAVTQEARLTFSGR